MITKDNSTPASSSMQSAGNVDVQKSDSTNDSAKSQKVLVVEDDLFLADLLGRKLDERFVVFQASDARKAQELLMQNLVDVICLDIILPGVNGITFLKSIKEDERLKQIPVLIISNLGQREEIDRGMEAGATDYLIKANVSLDEIVDRINSILARNGSGQEH